MAQSQVIHDIFIFSIFVILFNPFPGIFLWVYSWINMFSSVVHLGDMKQNGIQHNALPDEPYNLCC